jgi:transcriptional regulator GlxA family with amidase domain
MTTKTSAAVMGSATSKLICFLAFDGANALDIAGPLEAFSQATRFCRSRNGDSPYETIVASIKACSVQASSGLSLIARRLPSPRKHTIDTFIVPGGREYDPPKEMVTWIKAAADETRRVCSVCTGAFSLAAAGVLSGRRATTHWMYARELAKRHPDIDVDPDRIFIRDGRVWTSAGITAGIDLALALIEDDLGHDVAMETAKHLVMFLRRQGGQTQFSTTLAAQIAAGGKFARLHAWMADRLDQDLRIERLAAAANMSTRTFARAYLQSIGSTPAKMVEVMRIEAACRALESSRLSLKEIATASGFGDEQNLRRAFLRRRGIAPHDYRARFAVNKAASPPRSAPKRRKASSDAGHGRPNR